MESVLFFVLKVDLYNKILLFYNRKLRNVLRWNSNFQLVRSKIFLFEV